jgi:hypothetical protein
MHRFLRDASLTLALAVVTLAAGCRDAAQTSSQATCTPCLSAVVRPAATEHDLAREIHKTLIADGGCTIDPHTARPDGPLDAYAVSRSGYEMRLAEPPTIEQILRYLRQHQALLAHERIYVGAWRDAATGAHYLDLTELIEDRALAEARGRAHGQRCIYHLATGSEIRLQ